MSETRRLYRSRKDRVLCGVCGGIAEYLNIDPTIIRLAFVALALLSHGWLILLYFIACIIMPEEPSEPGRQPPQPPPPPKFEEFPLYLIFVALGIAFVLVGLLMLGYEYLFLWKYYKLLSITLLIAIGIALILYAFLEAEKEKKNEQS